MLNHVPDSDPGSFQHLVFNPFVLLAGRSLLSSEAEA
jgi:hypothetical protein